MLASTAPIALLALLLSPLIAAHDAHGGFEAPAHLVARKTPAAVKALFANSPKTYPATDVPGPKPRSAWVTAYQKAKKAGKIPHIPPTTIVDYNPVYPASYKGNPCNFYLTKCSGPKDIKTSPKGIVGISFDDGPQPGSLAILKSLKKFKLKATHFLIGSRIVDNQDILKQLITAGEHLAVHTWSHQYTTSLTDSQVLGELGWTMQAIVDASGKYPAYLRWPYGDGDNRVRAIAHEVFGLTTVAWTEDPRDWCLSDAAGSTSACGVGNGPQNLKELNAELATYVKDPKAKGLIILQHENGARPASAFATLYPKLLKAKWIPKSIPDMTKLPWYQ